MFDVRTRAWDSILPDDERPLRFHDQLYAGIVWQVARILWRNTQLAGNE
jgi:hypothetical protein